MIRAVKTRLFTTTIGKYYTLTGDWNTEHTDYIVTKIPYPVNVQPCTLDKDIQDKLHDYLLEPNWYSEEERQELLLAGCDLNPDNYASIECPYLPFIHYLYIPESWVI